MSNPDSFLDEVAEEVRRDRLFGLFRRYGWIGVLIVLGIVGGAAWNEWSKSQTEAQAQAFGDALVDALDTGTPEERRDALTAIPAEGPQAALLQLVIASDAEGDRHENLAALDRVAADTTLSPVYRDLAVLRRVLLAGSDMPIADRRAALQAIAVAGRPYRMLADEQLAYLLVEEGKTDAAIAALTALLQDQAASPTLRTRVGQMILVLGGTLPDRS